VASCNIRDWCVDICPYTAGEKTHSASGKVFVSFFRRKEEKHNLQRVCSNFHGVQVNSIKFARYVGSLKFSIRDE